jgi:hypothetical protein
MALHSIAFSGDVDTASRREKSVRTKAVALTPIEARMAQGARRDSILRHFSEVGGFRRPQGWVRRRVEAGHDPFVRVIIRQQYA